MNNKILMGILLFTVGGIACFSAVYRAVTTIDTITLQIDPLFSETAQSHIHKKCSSKTETLTKIAESLEQLAQEIPAIKTSYAWHTSAHKAHVYIKAHHPLAITEHNKIILSNGFNTDISWINALYYESLPRIACSDDIFPLSHSFIAWLNDFCAHEINKEYMLTIRNKNSFLLQSIAQPQFFIVTNDKKTMSSDVQLHCMNLLNNATKIMQKNSHKAFAADIRFAHQIVVYSINEKGDL